MCTTVKVVLRARFLGDAPAARMVRHCQPAELGGSPRSPHQPVAHSQEGLGAALAGMVGSWACPLHSRASGPRLALN